MNSEKFFKSTIKYAVSVLLIIAAIMIVIDPFSHFHMPWFGMGAVATDERTSLIGIAKNDQYEVAMIGSSMSENFVDSWFEDGYFGDSAVKFCLQGAHFNDYEVILDEVITHKELKSIVFGLDNYLLTDDWDEQEVTIPDYLSNDNIWDDCNYVWNKSAFLEYLPMFLIGNKLENGSDDNAYVWESLFPYGKFAATANYTMFRPEGYEERMEAERYFDNADRFLEKFTKYIKARPDVKFYIYAPPYSIMFWDYSLRKGRAEAEICLLERVYKQLLEYDNVELSYFQNDLDVITNLDNYRDYSHYKQAINYYMYTRIKDGSKRVTKDTYYDTLLNMYEIAVTYDYDSIFTQ